MGSIKPVVPKRASRGANTLPIVDAGASLVDVGVSIEPRLFTSVVNQVTLHPAGASPTVTMHEILLPHFAPRQWYMYLPSLLLSSGRLVAAVFRCDRELLQVGVVF